ncbi:alpha/beta fold hydrolase [Thermoflexus sp.]|nr:alpha/beta fold hydrolase [Thermoflexus sp.]MCS6963253.1 alpha/beta hydrolase-fold protein [Thermoflexus sp.]MCX7690632.1 alpha/beta hydrolase-fold protein [Thermoflexus sp.]MDW8065236.1 alpha/beta hydrolase-fold protein [Anaerolineae bacterium]MDW8184002.1 alpha/beta hydrolase-fold protein [Anaerolineae bacterium]
MSLIHHIRPPDGGPSQGKAPAALLLHGWSGDERSMAVFETAFPPGWWLIRPRGPFPLPGGGYAWFPLHGDGTPDLEAARESLGQLLRLLDELAGRHPIDPHRWMAVGFSQGGAMAAALALRAPERIAALAVFSGFFLPLPDLEAPASLAGRRAFIAHGLRDPLVPVEQSRRLCQRLQALGAETTCLEYPGGHKVDAGTWRAFRAWLTAMTPSPGSSNRGQG